MLLTRTASLTSDVAGYLAANKKSISRIRFYGDTAAVSPSARADVLRALN